MTKRLTTQDIEAIRERTEDTTFEKAYVKGDAWKGYEIKNAGNGLIIAVTSTKSDAEFISSARLDITSLLAEVERLRNGIVIARDNTFCEYTVDNLERMLDGREPLDHADRIGGD